MSGKKVAQTGRVVEQKRHYIWDIGVGEDSGWRELDREVVDELKKKIYDGDWGNTSLKGPSILHGQTSVKDGKVLLNDGKKIVTAVQEVYKENEDKIKSIIAKEKGEAPGQGNNSSGGVPPGQSEDDLPWLAVGLLGIFKDGWLMDGVVYEDNDKTTHIAIMCLSHEVDQNKFQATSVTDKAKLVQMMYRQNGSDWSRVKVVLTKTLGAAKRNTVDRWVQIGRFCDQETLDYIRSNPLLRDIPQKHVVENKYLVGNGAEAGYKMSVPYVKVFYGPGA